MSLSVAAFGLSMLYLGVLFFTAHWGDRRAQQGRSVIANPWIYALSLAVYATSWTFYGSVGRAAATGVGFLPIYLGPTLMATLFWLVLRKMIRISKQNRITTLADFMAARYDKSGWLAGLVTVIAVVGVVPYIALQLKAVSSSALILLNDPNSPLSTATGAHHWWADMAFYVAVLMAAFTVLFGTRHLDASERHEGLVTAVALESLVKLVAFLAVGLWVTYGLFDGLDDLTRRAAALPQADRLLRMGDTAVSYGSWLSLTFLSMLAFLFLPRQFQVGVVENVDERHLRRAMWLFPLYLLLINIFVLPITVAGLLTFPAGQVDADTFVLRLPMAFDHSALTLLVFLGGLSAATGMVIVESIALSTMICNDLVMPILLRGQQSWLLRHVNLPALMLAVRRGAVMLLMALGYLYYRIAGEAYALVSIGLVSFAAVAQFAPAMLGGMYWRHGTRAGAITGLSLGFALWFYTLLLPSVVRSGWLPSDILTAGPWGLAWLRPTALFGLSGLDDITHALFWTFLVNIGGYVTASLMSYPSAQDRARAALFVDVFTVSQDDVPLLRGKASVDKVLSLVERFLGTEQARAAFHGYAQTRGLSRLEQLPPDAPLLQFAQNLLAGTLGATSARHVLSSVVEAEELTMRDVAHILDEASRALAYARELEDKRRELEALNERLRELDRLKDDFISTITHELRTPLTSIRALSEILHGDPDLRLDKRREFLGIIVRESERLSRLINQVLDLAKLESGRADWTSEDLDLGQVARDAAASVEGLSKERQIGLALSLPEQVPTVLGDRDRLQQVLINLLSNALKFCEPGQGRIELRLSQVPGALQVDVIDNGPGIDPKDQATIFEKFRQGSGDTLTAKPAGTGLGLPISRQIVEHLGGRLWVHSVPGQGSTFSFTLPLSGPSEAPCAHGSTTAPS